MTISVTLTKGKLKEFLFRNKIVPKIDFLSADVIKTDKRPITREKMNPGTDDLWRGKIDFLDGGSDNSDSDSLSSSDSDFQPAIKIRYPTVDGKETIPHTTIETDRLFAMQTSRQLAIIYYNSNHILPECKNSPHITSTNMKTIKDLIKGQPFNVELFELLFCIAHTGFVLQPPWNKASSLERSEYVELPGDISVINKVTNRINSIAKGASGRVYDMAIKDSRELSNQIDEFVLLKASITDQQEKDNIVHEFFVGLVLNKLRTTKVGAPQTPNFTYVYALFKCFPGFDREEGGASVCAADGNFKKYYMVTEYVRGQELDLYVTKINFEDILSLYSQILLSLYTAWSTYDFTHYDLHISNVMVVDLEELNKNKSARYQLIPYWIGAEMIYVKATLLAKIIDYGSSHIAYDTVDGTREYFGYIPHYMYGVSSLRPLDSDPVYDLYRITGDIAVRLRQSNIEVFRRFLPLFLRLPGISLAVNLDDIDENAVNDMDVDRLETISALGQIAYSGEKHRRETDGDGDNNQRDILEIFADLMEFIKTNYPDLRIFHNENEKNAAVSVKHLSLAARGGDPVKFFKEAAVYRCDEMCSNIETIKQAISYSSDIKRRK